MKSENQRILYIGRIVRLRISVPSPAARPPLVRWKVGHPDRIGDAPRRFDSPIRGARDGLESVECDDTRTNISITYDEHPLLRGSLSCLVAKHREMGLGPFENVPTSPIFSQAV